MRFRQMSAAAVFTLLVGSSCARVERRPSVLLITLDTFRADRIGPATPNLLRLANESVRFENAEAPAPLTLPAHATMLSGVLPLHHGVRVNGAGSFPQTRPTLATLFAARGYRTGAFVGAFVLDHRFGLNRGFDVYDDAITRDPNDTSSGLEAQRAGGEVVDAALAWLRHPDARPFFAWVHLYDAHAPYSPPPPYPQTYDGEIQYVDHEVGRLLASIDRKHTVVVVVGDHGESLGEHGELTHGLLLYEATLHVPLIIADAARLRPRVVRTPVSTADVAPTIATLGGATLSGTDGRDLSDALLHRGEPKESDVYSESAYPRQFGWSELAALRRGDEKLIGGPSAELYDLGRDRSESTNILEANRRRYRELQASLDRVRASASAANASSVDAETRAKLTSLGYIAPTDAAASSDRDPKQMIALFNQFERAMLALGTGQQAIALPLLRNVVAADPTNAAFRSSLARAYRESGDSEHAIALYREAVALAPNDADRWYDLATALQDAGKSEEARVALDEVVRREPRRPEAHNALGVAYAAEGKFDAGAAEFGKALDLDPRNARAYNNLGNLYRAANRLDEAESAYRKAIELAPRYADALNGLGSVLVQKNRPRDAIPQFDAALRMAPAFYEAQLNRGIALAIAGDGQGARTQWQRLLRELPSGKTYDAQRSAARQLLQQVR